MTTSSEPVLSEAERLAALDQDLRQLQLYCQQNDLTMDEVREALKPLVSAVNWSDAQQSARSALRMMVEMLLLFVIVYLVCRQTPIREAAFVGARVALVKVLPYWDWSDMYRLHCLVENPLFEGGDKDERSEDTCQSCELLTSLERLSNVSSAEFTHNYLREDRPFIVTDATADWPAIKDGPFDRQKLIELLTSENLRGLPPCELKTNLKVHGKMHALLSKMSNPIVKKWFAQWENCEKTVSKAMRTLYKRPYFLPAMVDTSDSNWVIVSSNYTGNIYKLLPVVNDMVWMAQLQGSSQLRLVPRAPCQTVCAEITDTLRTGEMLVFTDFMWTMEYLPGHGTDNLAIGTGGFWQ